MGRIKRLIPGFKTGFKTGVTGTVAMKLTIIILPKPNTFMTKLKMVKVTVNKMT